jgi:hypothetical protein
MPKPGDWIILKEEHIKKRKKDKVSYFKYAVIVVKYQHNLYILKNGVITIFHSPLYRLALEKEIRIGKLKGSFLKK